MRVYVCLCLRVRARSRRVRECVRRDVAELPLLAPATTAAAVSSLSLFEADGGSDGGDASLGVPTAATAATCRPKGKNL